MATDVSLSGSPPTPQPGRGFDPLQIAFWLAVAIGVTASGVAISAGPSVGRVGAILLILLAAAGLVMLIWMARGGGRKLGAFPERGALEAALLGAQRSEFAVVDALDEPAMITDRALTPLTANGAYMALAESAGALGDSDRPPILSRMFGADALASAPLFRLARAAGNGQTRRELLPPSVLKPGGAPVAYEASVGAMPGGKVLWRLREVGEGAFAAAQENRQTFLDDAPIGFFVARADGSVAFMNKALITAIGLSGDVLPLKVRDFAKDEAWRMARRDRKSFGTARSRFVLRAQDGGETPATAVSFWPIDDEDGEVRTLVFFDDGESQRGGSAHAEESGEAIGLAPFGAAVLDGADPANAAIIDANAALMEMTQGKAAPGAAFADLFDASEGPNELAQRLRRAIDRPVELTIASNPPVSAHVHFARAADGRGLAYFVNVSEQRELEVRLAQAEKMREIGELAAGVAHDFNNLLTVVMQTCSYLLRRHPVGDADYPMLREISDHATTAKELSEMLRAYARQQTFAREIFDVSDFVGQRQELIRRIMGENITLEIRHGRELPFVKVDKTQLERVVVNLATNARDAMNSKNLGVARDGKLTIRTQPVTADDVRAMGHNPIEDGVYAMIEVEDTGSGIKAEHAAKIFRPYHSTKSAGQGTGLGLATSYGIIKQSGGYIFFDSEMGVGTKFRIFLPAYEPSADELVEMAERERAILAPPPRDVAGRGKILFVEDQAAVRRSIVRNLKDCGYEVEEAENGEEALHILTAKPGVYDMIISDVSMPIMSGPEMLQAAGMDMIGKAKVLFLSGYAPESFSSLLENYPVHYMSKPVTMEQLVGRVKDILAN